MVISFPKWNISPFRQLIYSKLDGLIKLGLFFSYFKYKSIVHSLELPDEIGIQSCLSFVVHNGWKSEQVRGFAPIGMLESFHAAYQ
jgi:hypothetical protein